MNIGKACAVFEQISSDEYSDAEKLEAVREVVKMPTHNGITKAAMLDVLRWFVENVTIDNGEQPTVGSSRWIPVTERLPEKAGDYLCVCDEGEEPCIVIIQYNDEQEAFGHEAAVYDPDSLGFVDTEFEKWNVTHWMPIPEPPEVE